MSPTMILGRVILPVLGLSLGVVLGWQILLPMLTAAVGSAPRDEKPSPTSPVALADGPTIVAEGKVVPAPGARRILGAEVAGTLARLPLAVKAVVKKGDLLAEFRSDEVAASIREAAARLAEAEIDLTHCTREGLDLDLKAPLSTDAPWARDSARHDIAAARSRRDAARAALDRLEVEKNRYRVVSPIDGIVTARHAEVGETVALGAPVVTVIDLEQLRIQAEVDEFDIPRCAVGASARLTAEGYDERSWRAEVEDVADVVISRSIRPEDPARPSDTGILPVRIVPREPIPLKIGQRVEVRISTPIHRDGA